MSERLVVGRDETGGSLHDRLMIAGAGLVVKTVEGIIEGTLDPVGQETISEHPELLKQAPKLFREHCRIDWSRNVNDIHNQIRGLNPVPGAYADLPVRIGESNQIKIFRSVIEKISPEIPAGEFLSDGKSFLKIAARDGFIHLLEVQAAGRKVMNIGDFLRGFGRLFSETPGI